MRTGMSAHQCTRMKTDEWLTPPEILNALGRFDLDPCAPIIRPWDMASEHYTITDNGLWRQWYGRVWLNPPYGSESAKWLDKMVGHGNGIALIFARTETKTFFKYIWNQAQAVLFIEGRLFFHHVDGTRAKNNSGAPSVLIAYGSDNAKILKSSGIKGKYINLSMVE